jgi:phosphoglycerate dehydrogenase-like enzyme
MVAPARTSFPKSEISVLLLENIHASADELFGARGEGWKIERASAALREGELIERIRDVHVLGIRSKTRVTPAVLAEARRLLAIGAFCIGTNQIACDAAAHAGVPVFNAPYSNTRSVAELVLAEIVFLARQLGDRVREVHGGRWRKVSAGCHEVRGKTLGIIGYGHIGTQVGVLAEAFGMRVLYFDIATKLAVGNVRAVPDLRALLASSDFVTLHVPETPQTQGMIGAAELAAMRPGAHLLNASRGTVVDVEALAAALRAGHLAGAAVDVFPEEPEGASDDFQSPLARAGQRHPDAAHRRLDRGGPGEHRPRGRDLADQVRQHRGHHRRGQLPRDRDGEHPGHPPHPQHPQERPRRAPRHQPHRQRPRRQHPRPAPRDRRRHRLPGHGPRPRRLRRRQGRRRRAADQRQDANSLLSAGRNADGLGSS